MLHNEMALKETSSPMSLAMFYLFCQTLTAVLARKNGLVIDATVTSFPANLEPGMKQDFMSSSQQFYWIGLSYSEEQNAWLWESGSVLSQDLFPLFGTSNRKNCIAYNPKGNAVDEPCEIKNRFIYHLIWRKSVTMS
ncbi:natural killer cells antigen CD94 isoform X1 [Callithrix jacchus]